MKPRARKRYLLSTFTVLSLGSIASEPTARSSSNVEVPREKSESSAPAFDSPKKTPFRLITRRCEGQEAAGPESTPQTPPLNIDDPSTPGCNQWEFNVEVDGDLRRRHRAMELPLLDISYGIGDNFQLSYDVPYTNIQTGSDRKNQIGASWLGTKYSFYNDERRALEMGFAPAIGLDGSGIGTTTFPFLVTKKIGTVAYGDLDLTSDLIYTLSKKSGIANSLGALVGIGLPLSNRVGLMGELASQRDFVLEPEERRELGLRADVGVTTTVNQHFLLFGSVGHSIVSADDANHAYVLIGFRLLAGKGKPNDPVVGENSVRP